jgi:hypothetical protein
MARAVEPTMKDKPRKFEVVYKDDDGEYIWKYDLDKFPNGPISVENKYTSQFQSEMKKKHKESFAEKRERRLKEMEKQFNKKDKKSGKEPTPAPNKKFW